MHRPLMVLGCACLAASSVLWHDAMVEAAQEAERQPNLRIVAVGGFLGRIEGFMDLRGGPYDLDPPPYGGVAGVRAWRRANPGGIFLVAGDNLPRRFSGQGTSVSCGSPEQPESAAPDDHSRLGASLGEYDRYPVFDPDSTFDGKEKHGALWVDASAFRAFVMDAMRHRTGADIAIVSRWIVDQGVIEALAREHKRPLDWLSRFVVEHAIFRPEPIVRTEIKGDKLAATLKQIIQNDDASEGEFCVAGLGQMACPLSTINEEHIVIKGRDLDKNHFYSLALPQDVAVAHNLDYDPDDSIDLIDAIDQRFRAANLPALTDPCAAAGSVIPPAVRNAGAALSQASVVPPPKAGEQQSLADRLEDRQSKKLQLPQPLHSGDRASAHRHQRAAGSRGRLPEHPDRRQQGCR